MENAENFIFEPLDFKIFWGRMPLGPPTNSRLRRSFSSPPPPQLKICSAVPASTTELRIARILDRELNGRAVKYNHFKLKNIAFDEKKFPMLF